MITDFVCKCSNNDFSVTRETGMMMVDTMQMTTTKFDTTTRSPPRVLPGEIVPIT